MLRRQQQQQQQQQQTNNADEGSSPPLVGHIHNDGSGGGSGGGSAGNIANHRHNKNNKSNGGGSSRPVAIKVAAFLCLISLFCNIAYNKIKSNDYNNYYYSTEFISQASGALSSSTLSSRQTSDNAKKEPTPMTTTTTTTTSMHSSRSSSASSSWSPPSFITFQNFDHLDDPTFDMSSSSSSPNKTKFQWHTQRKYNATHPPPPWRTNSTLPVPFPIFVSSLPKSATVTTNMYFKCGKQKASHQICGMKGCPDNLIGYGVHKNMAAGKAPLEDVPILNIFSDTGIETPTFCFHSTFHLQMFYDYYPNMTIVHVIRNTTSWYNSISKYQNGRILTKWRKCAEDPLGVFPIVNGTQSDFERLYERHTAYVRTFAKYRPSITYVEFQLEDPKIAEKMEAAFGIDRKCWGHSNVNNKK